MAAMALALAGCADGIGTILADPGRYSVFHCKDMVPRWTYLKTREKELRDLMIRASEGTGGSVIGAMSYRPEYEQIHTEQSLLRRAAADKKCELEPPRPNFQSDSTIR